jgi:beta-lactamase superfamily II metal-dependent hydrolase
MYNMGFGDCFLLACRGSDEEPRFVLIDCGIHRSYRGKTDRAKKVLEDIAEATGKYVDVVAITHEHEDHFLGFDLAKSLVDEMSFGELWLPWTEDPSDPFAEDLHQRRGIMLRALRQAVARMQAAGLNADRLKGLLDFEDLDAVTGPISGLSATTREQPGYLKLLMERAEKQLTRSSDYRTPGEEPYPIPDVPGIRVFTLGPTRDEDILKRLQSKSELYQELWFGETGGFCMSALAASDELEDAEGELAERNRPFDSPYRIAEEEARKDPFFRKHYGSSDDAKHEASWRRIDHDWLGGAEELALKLNSLTNNTSLVLAFELGGLEKKKVLLFTGDAQLGNWLGWHELKWTDGDETIDATDLLGRTVLYKVGHHGSHNATLKRKGLELMTSPDLAAMIPVDETWANDKMNWKHPAHVILEALEKRTNGRILRTDRIPGDGELPKPDAATEQEWETFTDNVTWDSSGQQLWIQYTVPAD